MAAARYAHWARSPPHAFSPGLRPRNRAHWSDGCTIPDVTLNRSLVLDGPGSEPVARLVRRLEHGAPVQLAVLGASVTSGHGIAESPVSNYTWPAQLERQAGRAQAQPHPRAPLLGRARPHDNTTLRRAAPTLELA